MSKLRDVKNRVFMKGWRLDGNCWRACGGRRESGVCGARHGFLRLGRNNLAGWIAGGFLLVGLLSVSVLGGIHTYEGNAVPIPYGRSVTATIDVSGETASLTALSITLNIQGGRNADLSVILRAPGENAPYIYLINRPGVGYNPSYNYNNDRGFLITLSDSAVYDVHRYREYNPVFSNGVLTGEWQPDGRNISPNSSSQAFAAATRVSLAQVFAGVNPAGRWVLELQDWHPGGQQSTLMGWSLEISAVPEPVVPAIIIFIVVLGLGLAIRNWRWIRFSVSKAPRLAVRGFVQG